MTEATSRGHTRDIAGPTALTVRVLVLWIRTEFVVHDVRDPIDRRRPRSKTERVQRSIDVFDYVDHRVEAVVDVHVGLLLEFGPENRQHLGTGSGTKGAIRRRSGRSTGQKSARKQL